MTDVAQSSPYLMVKKEKGLVGNDQFEGYAIDLADKICKQYLHVDYVIRLVADNKYGEQENGTWNGMVGERTTRVSFPTYCAILGLSNVINSLLALLT